MANTNQAATLTTALGVAKRVHGKLQDLEQDPNVHGHFDQTRVKWRRLTVP